MTLDVPAFTPILTDSPRILPFGFDASICSLGNILGPGLQDQLIVSPLEYWLCLIKFDN